LRGWEIRINFQLTAIIPIRGMADRLDNLKETLLKCANLPIQVLLIHDDAEDGTEEQLQEFLKQLGSPQFSKITKICNSPGIARNVGLEHKLAPWFCFWDSDDLPEPNLYLEMIRIANLKDADLAVGLIQSKSITTSSEIYQYSLQPKSPEHYLELANMPAFTRFVFKSHIFRGYKFTKSKIGEDQCFLSDTNFLSFRIAYLQKIVYTYLTDFSGQLTKNVELTGELSDSLNYLARSLRSKPPEMKKFADAQFLKLFIAAVRNKKGFHKLDFTARIYLEVARMVLNKPFTLIQNFKYFSKNRVKLAGRI
jgi:glycosyltransferase involved in cell wall biosynthesis